MCTITIDVALCSLPSHKSPSRDRPPGCFRIYPYAYRESHCPEAAANGHVLGYCGNVRMSGREHHRCHYDSRIQKRICEACEVADRLMERSRRRVQGTALAEKETAVFNFDGEEIEWGEEEVEREEEEEMSFMMVDRSRAAG